MALLAASAAACSPTLDWREVRIAGGAASGLLPCRPETRSRTVRLAEATSAMTLLACSAGGSTWALAAVDVVDPARVGPALAELRSSAERNLGAASVSATQALRVPGATPQPGAGRLAIDGRLPDGKPVREHAALFAVGTVVVQATVLGESPAADATETFFGALRAGR